MALVTIQRSPSPSTDNDGAESSEDVSDGKSQLRKSLSESYFTVKGAALILPHNECTRKTTKKSHGGEMQHHLQAMLHILRPEDTIKIAIRLEDVVSNYHRYMALVSTRGRQDTEECVILGLDCGSAGASVGLVLPVWLGLKMKLGGDGGFSLYTDEHSYLFKPVSVQAMWSAIQSLVKVVNTAETMKYIHDGLTHTWVGYYKSRVNHSDHGRQGQWNIEGIEVFAPSSLSIKSDDEKECIKLTISQRLKEVMMVVDLDEATSIGLRRAVEEKMGISLTEFKGYFDEEVMRILGQMDEPSEILEFLYLGSEWNASNLEELQTKGIGYILNVTKEIDNFFMGMLQYYNVRVMDVEESDLLKHWDKTYKFICKARSNHSKVLVHCKMGISRSASTVMAFLMKDRRWSVDEAFKFVKSKRSVVKPNDGFMEQLNMYEGILTASNKRDIFRSKSDQNLLDDANNKDDSEPVQGSFLGDSLFHVMSHSDWPMAASGGVAYEEEWIADLQAGRGMTPELMQMEGDLEAAEARSADSMDDAVPDEVKPSGSAADTPLDLELSEQTGGDNFSAPNQREGKSSSAPPAVECVSFGEDGSGGGRGSAAPRSIKPDSSWIKPASLDLGPDMGESSTDDVAATETAHIVPCTPMAGLNTTAATNETEADSNQCQAADLDPSSSRMTLLGATETESTDGLPVQVISDDQKIHRSFHSTHEEASMSVASQPAETLEEHSKSHGNSDHQTHLHGGDINPKSVALVDACDIADEANISLTHATPPNVSGGSSADHSKPKTSSHSDAAATPTESSSGNRPKIEMGVRQYFFREKIPWSPGKVQKMREGINKTGHLLADDEVKTANGAGQEIVAQNSPGADLPRANLLLSPSAGMSQSRSCMELGSMGTSGSDSCGGQAGSSEGISLYEKEEIPLEPGTVLRTRREIEERHRFLVGGTEEENDEREVRPVLRTSSLKQDRSLTRLGMGTARLSGDTAANVGIVSSSNRRSLDDLRRIGSDDFEALCGIEKIKSSLAAQGSPTKLEASIGTKEAKADTEENPECPRPKGNLDTDTLALIREIGSALLMSPTSPSPPGEMSGVDGESNNREAEPCSNTVKYFVRKIEQQQQPPLSSATPAEIPTPSISASKGLCAGDDTARGIKEETFFYPHHSEVDCLNKTKSSALQDSAYAKTCPVFSSSGYPSHPNVTQEKNISTSSPNEHSDEILKVCCNKTKQSQQDVSKIPGLSQETFGEPGQGEEEHPPVFESPAQTPGEEEEEDSPTVKHLVGKFESGQGADLPCVPLSLPEHSKGAMHNTTQLKDITSVSDSLLSSLPAKEVSSTLSSSTSPFSVSRSAISSTFPSHGGSQGTSPNARDETTKRNIPDYDIPVELYELPSSGPGHTQHQKRTATSLHTSPPPLGPMPFCRKNLSEMSRESHSWRSVRPKSASGTLEDKAAPTHNRRIGSADYGQHFVQERTSGVDVDTEVTFRRSSGEEGRKKRRLHGKSLPLPSAFRVGEQQETQSQPKPTLGQGPFYSSM